MTLTEMIARNPRYAILHPFTTIRHYRATTATWPTRSTP